MRRQIRASRGRTARRSSRLSEVVVGVVVLLLVAAGTFLLPSQVESTGAEAGVVVEQQRGEADSQIVLR